MGNIARTPQSRQISQASIHQARAKLPKFSQVRETSLLVKIFLRRYRTSHWTLFVLVRNDLVWIGGMRNKGNSLEFLNSRLTLALDKVPLVDKKSAHPLWFGKTISKAVQGADAVFYRNTLPLTVTMKANPPAPPKKNQTNKQKKPQDWKRWSQWVNNKNRRL